MRMSFRDSAQHSQNSKPDLGKVLEHYGFELPRNRGSWQTIRCEFHGDHVKSARVNLEEGAYKCFACDISGDVYSVVMKFEGVKFREAIEIAEGIAGESRQQVRGKSARGSSLSGGSRYSGSNGSYVPPRLRKGT